MKLFIVVFFTIVFATKVLAGTIDPNTEEQKYLEYGSKFHCVLELIGVDQEMQPFFASSVAIGPHWIITASHVVHNCNTCFVSVGDKAICIEKVICHEKFQDGIFGEYDIALGYVKQDLGLDFYPQLYSKHDEEGKICCIAGFGLTGNFNTGMNKKYDGKRRAGSNKIDYIDKKLLMCGPSRNNRTELEFLIAHGDSGGGLFIENELAGINSCIIGMKTEPTASYGNESGHTRISKYIDWITKNMKEVDDEKSKK